MMKNLSEPHMSGYSKDFVPFTDTTGFWGWLSRLYNVGIRGGTTDGVIVICGNERSGKTELAFRIAYGLNPNLWFNQDGTVNINNYCGLGQRYAGMIAKGKRGDILIFDEAGTSMYSRDAMSEINKDLNKKLFVCGYKNLLHILCVPDYFAIDTNIRKHRVKALIRIVSKGKFFTYSKKAAIKIGTEKSWNVAATNSRGWWAFSNRTEGYAKFTNACRAEEQRYKDEYLEAEVDIDILPKGRLYKLSEIANKLEVSTTSVWEWCKDSKLNLIRVGNAYRMTQEQLDLIVKTNIKNNVVGKHDIYNKGRNKINHNSTVNKNRNSAVV